MALRYGAPGRIRFVGGSPVENRGALRYTPPGGGVLAERRQAPPQRVLPVIPPRPTTILDAIDWWERPAPDVDLSPITTWR